MLSLPTVTLNIIETLEHELGRMAVNECLRKAKFGHVLICTDKPELWQPLDGDAEFVQVENWPTKLQWSKFSWHGVAPLIRTPHILHTQWDSWIWLPEMWRDEYLDCDLIGAPWWRAEDQYCRNVGNLGFSLRSAAIMRYITKHRDRFPIVNAFDDDLVCRKYRLGLEDAGFRFGSESLAREFAFEVTRPAPNSKHFGFHAAFRFADVLDHDALLERARIMSASPYLKKTGYIWKAFAERCPEIIAELEEEAKPLARYEQAAE